MQETVAAIVRGREPCRSTAVTREAQGGANIVRPAAGIESMVAEQRQRDALEAEADAGGVTPLAVVLLDAPELAEVILVIVEAQARRRLVDAVDRNEQLELQALLALAA